MGNFEDKDVQYFVQSQR